jgi:hypothetical protein
MRLLIIAALVAAQSATPVAANAAEFATGSGAIERPGAFVGARLRLSLGGRANTPRLALAAAPVLHATTADGGRALRMGEGAELTFANTGAPKLSLGGRPAARLIGHTGEVDKDRAVGVSTLGWVGIGLGVLAAAALTLAVVCSTSNCMNSD